MDGKRCDWCGTDPLYVTYHDTEWGVPDYDDRALYEKLMLDGFQAGVQNAPRSMADVPAQTEASQALSKALKKKGFKFCGPTIVYAVMQACGLVNDHMVDCPRHEAVRGIRR